MLAVLIPVKDLPKAKARLAPVLDEAGRRELIASLYLDVLGAALGCAPVGHVAVVTRDEEALHAANAAGAEGMDEPGDLNASLDSAARNLIGRGVDRIMVLHADLPFVTSDDIAAVGTSQAEVALVASGDGGTNALACPAGAFAFHFGPGSAQDHRQAAWGAGLEPELLDLPNISLDIDTPADLARVRAAVEAGRTPGTHTAHALMSLGQVAEPGRTGRL